MCALRGASRRDAALRRVASGGGSEYPTSRRRVALPRPSGALFRRSVDDATTRDGTTRASELISPSLSLFLSARTPSRLDWRRGHVDPRASLSLFPSRERRLSRHLPLSNLLSLSLFLSQGTWLSALLSLPLSLRRPARVSQPSRLAVTNEANFRSRIDVLSGYSRRHRGANPHSSRAILPSRDVYIPRSETSIERVVLSRSRGTAVARTELLFPLPATHSSFFHIRDGSELARALSIKSRVKNNDCFSIGRRRRDFYIDFSNLKFFAKIPLESSIVYIMICNNISIKFHSSILL